MALINSVVLYRCLAIAWMMLIFILSAQPYIPTPDIFSMQDKLFHLFCYAILGALVARSWYQPAIRRSLLQITLITSFVTLYGISDEVHQSFVPGRDPSVGDVIADALGGLIAAVLTPALRPKSPPAPELIPEKPKK